MVDGLEITLGASELEYSDDSFNSLAVCSNEAGDELDEPILGFFSSNDAEAFDKPAVELASLGETEELDDGSLNEVLFSEATPEVALDKFTIIGSVPKSVAEEEGKGDWTSSTGLPKGAAFSDPLFTNSIFPDSTLVDSTPADTVCVDTELISALTGNPVKPINQTGVLSRRR